LIRRLPGGQTLVTTASAIPEGVEPQRFLRVTGGTVVAE
jgi:hypothetical protein